MDLASFDELWRALGRTYDDTLEMKESIRKYRQSNEALSEAAGRLLSAVEGHHRVVESHERRPDRTEITVEAIVEDLRRHREGHSPQ